MCISVVSDNHKVIKLWESTGKRLFSYSIIKMPGYKRSEKYAPSVSESVDSLEKRFVMPKLTLVQLVILSLILYTAFRYKNFNKQTLAILSVALGLFHVYDHLFLTKRGKEEKFLGKKSEGYCSMCQK